LIKAWRNNQKGVWFVAGGFLGLIISAVTWVFYVKYSQNFRYEINSLLTSFIYAAVPLGLSAFMASRFRDLNTNLEQKVKERTLELQQSLEELRSTQTQLIHSEKMASLGALTAGIAHEIQNPLNFVNNFSEVSNEMILELLSKKEKARLDVETGQGKSERDETSEDEILNDISKNLEKILHNGKRADAIVKGMLQHSRTNTGQKEAVNVNTLAGEYLRLSYHGMRAKDNGFNADLKTDFDPDLPKITAVPQDIGRVLLNLINNAFYAVDQRNRSTVAEQQRNRTVLNDQDQNPSSSDSETYKPVVTVSTKNLGQRIEISVRDNGDGIPEEIKDKIFQPFFTTKPAGQGTGLGLSLAYDIVKAHGGELKVETREGEGTRFTIALPVL
jgi:signal transduction histidine kinase